MPIAVVKDGFSTEHAPLAPGIGLAQVLGNNSEEAPLHCGSYRMEPGTETTTDYPCSIFCLTLEGEFTAEDMKNPGNVLTIKKHDMFRADKGDSVKWSTATGGHSFYVIQLPGGTDPTPYFSA